MTERRNATSASQAPYDALCQGRHQAQIGLPDIPSSDATFGEDIHEAVATGEEEGLNAPQLSITDSCREIEQKLVAQVFGADAEKCKVFREERFWCQIPVAADSDKTYEHSGKPDVVYRLGPIALDIEFKALVGNQQNAAEHMQMRDQVVLVARGLLCTEVYAAMVQPLVTHSPDLVRYEAVHIAQAEQEMFERVRRSNAPNAPRTAGEVQCKFCKARSTCKEYAMWASTKLPIQVSIFDTPVAEWTPEQCMVFLDRLPTAHKWLTECKEQMKARLKANPEAIPGWYLEPGAVRSKVSDMEALHSRFLEAGGRTTEFMKCITLVKKEFEMELRKATKLKGKAFAKAVEDMLRGITTEKQSEPSISRKSK